LAAADLTIARDLVGESEQSADARMHSRPFTVEGGVSLARATVNGDVRFTGVALRGDGTGRPALDASNLKTGGELSYRGIAGGSLVFAGARLQRLAISGDAGEAGEPDRIDVGASDMTSESVEFVFPDAVPHRVDLRRARVGELKYQVLGGTGTRPKNRRSASVEPAVDATGLIAQEALLDFEPAASGHVDLSRGRVGELTYVRSASRPRRTQARIRLDGLVYDRLNMSTRQSAAAGNSDDVSRRIRWLDQTAWPFAAQPFEQLASLYRGLGDDRAARKVLLWKHRRQRQRSWGSPKLWLIQVFRLIQDVLTGYGYAPGRALAWLSLAYAAGLVYFQSHQPDPVAGTEPPTYRPWLFVLDSLLPTSPFGQQALWRTTGAGFAIWFSLQVLGWLLVLSVLPAVGRSLSRD
jgi:hypothetical protein